MSNILVNKGVAKIADFGFALFTNRSFKDINIGSPLYMSPEGMLKNIYGPKTDVWAFGIMVFELIHGTTPFSSCTSEKELRESVIKPLQLLHFRDNLSTELKDLVTRCMEVKESLRPTIA